MKTNQEDKTPLSFEVDKSKENLRKELASYLSPEERLQKLTRIIHFNKQFSKNYHKAVLKRMKESNTFILK